MASEPLIVDIRRNALDDGPGIRSTVFFKGCVLRCAWCQNPETISPRPELQQLGGRCIGCGSCADVCPHGAAQRVAGAVARSRERCQRCGTCVEPCPAAALRIVGQRRAIDELVALLLRDEPFFRNSGGGVTFSGGEPTLHLDYVAELAARLRAHGIHTLLETCGLYRAEEVERRLLPHLDAIYFDVKLADGALHARHTGADNAPILANLARLAEQARERVLPRVPLIPGLTDTDENLAAIAELLRGLGFARVALLPYNPLYLGKRAELGLAAAYVHDRFMSREQLARCHAAVARGGLTPIDG